MKQGRTWDEVETELGRIAQERRDLHAPSRLLDVWPVGEEVALEIELEGGREYCQLDQTAHEQLSEWLKIPRTYYERLRREAPGLYRSNVRHWSRNAERMYLIRLLGNDVRAVLSTRYRPLDNDALAHAVLPVLRENGFEIESSEVGSSRLFIKAVSAQIEEPVREGDVVRMAVSISNSEVGAGALRIDPMLFFLACTNGLVLQEDRLRKLHVGRNAEDIASAQEFFRDDTRQADEVVFWMKVQGRAPRHPLTRPLPESAREAPLGPERRDRRRPGKVVEVAARRLRFNDEERAAILTHFIRGHAGREELTRYGLAQAVSRASQDVASYARATELERLSGGIIELTPAEWRPLAEARAT